jgi:HNH endonuclease
MSVYIPREIRKEVWNDAAGLCGYCQTHEDLVGISHEFEHLIPRSQDGPTIRDNLWLSCRRCNSFKSDRTSGIDPETKEEVSLFHPRKQLWADHFCWVDIEIKGKTLIGRASVALLNLNLSIVMKARSVWILSDRFPPVLGK